MMRLGKTVKRRQLLKLKTQETIVYGLRGKCLMILCVLSDLTRLPILGGGRKSWYIIIIIYQYFTMV